MAKKSRTLWALDPFESKTESRIRTIETLRELAQHGALIEPVYVLSPEEYEINLEFNAPWVKKVFPAVQKVLDHAIQGSQIPGLLAPQVVIEKKPGLNQAVNALMDYAKRTRADLIVVGTHARKGLSRLVLGSFAETLLLKATLPVLVVGPERQNLKSKQSKTILFATDLEKDSLALFEKVLKLAKDQGSKIVLHYVIPHPVEPFLQSGVYLLSGGFLSYPDFVTQNENRKRKRAEQLVQLAQKQDVTVEVFFDHAARNIAEGILKQANRLGAKTIAMVGKSGPLTAAALGSISRQVVRQAHCPVWILRTK